MSGGSNGAGMRYMIGMLAVVVIFATSIIVTVALPIGQMYTMIKPTAQGAYISAQLPKDQGWVASDPLNTGTAGAHLVNGYGGPTSNIGYGKVVFLREGCFYCHTMMVEETKDWYDWGAPEPAGWWYKGRPNVNANERTGPDLQHVGTRLPSKTYLIQHERYPRRVVEADGATNHWMSVMPDFYWLSNNDLNAVVDFLRAMK